MRNISSRRDINERLAIPLDRQPVFPPAAVGCLRVSGGVRATIEVISSTIRSYACVPRRSMLPWSASADAPILMVQTFVHDQLGKLETEPFRHAL
jgi:hypothetical protein